MILCHALLSANSEEIMMKGVKHGACAYLVKPLHIELLKNIWLAFKLHVEGIRGSQALSITLQG